MAAHEPGAGAIASVESLRSWQLGRRVSPGIRTAEGGRHRPRTLGTERLRQHRSRCAAQATWYPEDHPGRHGCQHLHRVHGALWNGTRLSCDLRACPEIIESTFDRVKYWFTTDLSYHMLW